MVHDIRVVGNRFVDLSKQWNYRMTSVALNKLIYFAHGWHMAFHGEENRLLDDPFEVWRLGPVAPTAYHAFLGLGHVKRIHAHIPKKHRSELSEVELQTCDFVMRRYNHLEGLDLVDVTHAKGTPWYNHRVDLYSEIPRAEIAEFFRGVAERHNLTPDS